MKETTRTFKRYFFIGIMCIVATSCTHQNTAPMEHSKSKDESTGNGKYMISAPVIYKSFVKKNGAVTDQQELYIQRSIQDYFIKFCESHISREDLESHLATMEKEIKVVTLEVEFKNGAWDICDDNEEQQSRMGEYVIIHRIVTD